MNSNNVGCEVTAIRDRSSRADAYFPLVCRLATVWLLAVAMPPAFAGVDYSLEGSARLDEEFNSNIQLIPSQFKPKEVFGTNLGLSGTATAAAPTWKTWARARLDNYFYSPLDNLDRQNQIVDAGYTYLTEQSKWDITGNFTNDSILATETDLINSGFLIPGLIGRDLKSISPSWTYAIDDQLNFSLGYSYTESKYSSPPNVLANFPSSVTHSANTGLSYRLNDQFTLSSSLSYTTFSYGQKFRSQSESAFASSNVTSETSNAINYLTGMLALTYLYDQTTQANVSAGAQYSTTESETLGTVTVSEVEVLSFNPRLASEVTRTSRINQSRSDGQVAPVFAIGGSKKFENSELQFNFSRQISPSINGELLASDRLSLSAKHNLSKLIFGNVNFTYLDQERPSTAQISGSGGNLLNQTFLTMRGELSYRLTPQWILGAGYQYRLRDSGLTSGSFSGTQDAHSVFLNLRYDFEKLQF